VSVILGKYRTIGEWAYPVLQRTLPGSQEPTPVQVLPVCWLSVSALVFKSSG
jgi:hypothetical protein